MIICKRVGMWVLMRPALIAIRSLARRTKVYLYII